MALSESNSTVRPDRNPFRSHLSELRKTLLNSRTPPAELLQTFRQCDPLGISSPSPQTRSTHGHPTPQSSSEEPQRFNARPVATTRTWELRPSSMSSPSYSRSCSAAAASAPSPGNSVKQQRLSGTVDLGKGGDRQVVQDERAERRASLAHRITLAEYPRKSPLSQTFSPGVSSHPRGTVAPINGSATSADILAAVLQEKHSLDPERSSRALRIWDAMAQCLEEICKSIDGVPGKCSPQPLISSTLRTLRTSIFDQDSEEDGGSTSAQDHSGVKYPCPFRKRNPQRFNIRDHDRCARAPFHSMAALRKHVASHHRSKSQSRQCRRCRVHFTNDKELLNHLMLPKDQICEVTGDLADSDPEDGVSEELQNTLLTSSDQWTWERLWALLFPEDIDIPNADFQPIMELAEVDQMFDACQDPLKANLRATLRVLLPAEIEDDYCGFLAGQLELVFDTHRANVMRQCLSIPDSTALLGQMSPSNSEQQQQLPNLTRRSTRRRSRQSSTFTPSPTSPASFRLSSTCHHESTKLHPSATYHHSVESPAPIKYENCLSILTSTPHTPPPTETEDNGSPYMVATSPTLVNACHSPSRNDARDSGIGIPCEVCEMDAESCLCKGPLKPGPDEGRYLPNTAGNIISGAPKQHHVLRRQRSVRFEKCVSTPPDLSSTQFSWNCEIEYRKYDDSYYKTVSVGNQFTTGVPRGIHTGRYSPQSFKQRVLREKQSGGVQYSGTGAYDGRT